MMVGIITRHVAAQICGKECGRAVTVQMPGRELNLPLLRLLVIEGGVAVTKLAVNEGVSLSRSFQSYDDFFGV